MVDDWLSGVPEGSALDKPPAADLKGSARRAHKQGEKAKQVTVTSIDSAREHLKTTEVWGRIRDFALPPSYDAVFANPAFADEIGAFETLTGKYLNPALDPDPLQLDQDIRVASAMLVRFSAHVDHTGACAADAEGSYKTAKARAYLEVREFLEKGRIRMNRETAESLAESMVEDRRAYWMVANTISRTISGYYYALRRFIEHMDRVAQRMYYERRNAWRQEA